MNGNVYFQIAGLFYIALLVWVFFSKKRLETNENKLILGMIFVSIFSLIFDVLNMYFTINSSSFGLINNIISKANLSLILVLIYLIGLYIYIISFNKNERISKDKDKLLTNIKKITLPGLSLSIIILFVLPIKVDIIYNVIHSSGIAINYIYIITGITIISWIYRYIERNKDIKREQRRIILTIIFLGILTLIISLLYPELLLIHLMKVFIIFYIYFNISNPDLDVLEELKTARLKVEKAEAETANTLLNVSHEIRTPLNTIIGFGESLLEEDINNDAKDEVKYIMRASNELLQTVNNLLDSNSSDIQKLKLTEEKYNLNNVIKQVVVYANNKIDNKKVEFKTKIDSKIPEELYGDHIRIKQIMLNLINNAIEYTTEGYIELDVSGILRGNIYRLIISVEDTGSGISEDKINLIFDKYNRNDDNLTIDSEGSNLGITKKLAEVMNGRISVISEEREGSKFTVILDQKLSRTPSKIDTKEKEINKNITDDFDISGKKILIVDDDNMNLKVAARLLKGYNLDITEVSSGLECLNKINDRNKYDLIFLDDLMPGMSGVETLKRLKKKDGFNTPVVVLTANASYGIKDEYIEKGFDDYVAKPIDRSELRRVLKRFLTKENK